MSSKTKNRLNDGRISRVIGLYIGLKQRLKVISNRRKKMRGKIRNWSNIATQYTSCCFASSCYCSCWGDLLQKQGSVHTNRIGMKFGTIVLQVIDWRVGFLIFKMAAMTTMTMTTARCSLLHVQQRPPATRKPAERVRRHWLAVCATVPDS